MRNLGRMVVRQPDMPDDVLLATMEHRDTLMDVISDVGMILRGDKHQWHASPSTASY